MVSKQYKCLNRQAHLRSFLPKFRHISFPDVVQITISTMGIRSSLLSCFTFFAVATLARRLTESEEKEFLDDLFMPYGSNETLIGSGTRSWLARYNDSAHSTDYTSIRDLELIFPNYFGDFSTPSLPESTNGNKNDKVVYPSVLLVMDYHTVTPLTQDRKWHPGQLFIYALAFWNSVSSAMKHFENPRVAIRVVGIVMTDSRNVLPYLNRNQGAKTYVNALSPMLDYWTKITDRNMNFLPGTYDIVVHMTDIKSSNNERSSRPIDSTSDPEFVVASEKSPCEMKNKIAGIIIEDKMNFEGIPRAVNAMKKVLGNILTTDTKSSASQDECMSVPKMIYTPGNPLPKVLPADFNGDWSECQIPGYALKSWTCVDSKTGEVRPGSTRADYSFFIENIIDCQFLPPSAEFKSKCYGRMKMCYEGRCYNES